MLAFIGEWWNRRNMKQNDPYFLAKGPHTKPEHGRCAMEWVSWLEGGDHTDHPFTVDYQLCELVAGINDTADDVERQKLKPYLPRLIGTKTDGYREFRTTMLDATRNELSNRATPYACHVQLGVLLVATAGMDAALEFLDLLLPLEKLSFEKIEKTSAAKELMLV